MLGGFRQSRVRYLGVEASIPIPFGKVDWTTELENPYEDHHADPDEDQNPGGSDMLPLIAWAPSLEIEGSDLFGRIALDMDIRADFDKDEWKCIRLGKDKPGSGVNNYVLLIRSINISGGYERIGAGVLLDSHISRARESVQRM